MIDLNLASRQCAEISQKRNQPKEEVMKHLTGEVIEAEEARLNMIFAAQPYIETNVKFKDHYAEELADCIICALSAAAYENIDIEKALIRKIEINAKR